MATNFVYTVVYLPADQSLDFEPYYKPIGVTRSPLLIHEEWVGPTIDIMPQVSGRFGFRPYKVTVNPDLNSTLEINSSRFLSRN